jgi:hypothetical protein
MKIIGAILELQVIGKILSRRLLDVRPPPRGRVRETGQD